MTTSVAIRALDRRDTDAALRLYTELTFGPAADDHTAFAAVLAHNGTTVFGAFVDDALVAILTLHLMPNVTWGARPYGLIENVITTSNQQRRGIGKTLMQHAIAAAWDADAFKVMLMTGQKRGAAGFYEAAGFTSEDKTAMVIRRP